MSGPRPVETERGDGPQPDIVPWRAREAVLPFIMSFVASAILLFPVTLVVADADLRRMLAVLLQAASLFVLVLWWVRRTHDAGPERLGLRRVTSGDLVAGFGTGAAGIVLAAFLSIVVQEIIERFTDTKVQNPEQLGLEKDPSALLLAVIAIAVIVFAPIAEETFWRGFVFRGMRRTMTAVNAIVWSGFLFGIVHLTAATSWELLGQYVFTLAIPIGALGCLLASVTERRRTIVPAILAHAMFNSFGFAMLLRDMV